MSRGLYRKYTIERTDGAPINEDHQYIVLNLSTDSAARVAMAAYAESIRESNPVFSSDLRSLLTDIYQSKVADR